MGKYPIYAILAGMLLVLASCIPVAGSLYRMAVPVTSEQFELTVNGRTQLDQQVKTSDHIMLVLIFELSPAHMREPGVSYRAVVRNGEQVQQRVSGSLEIPKGGHEPGAGSGGSDQRIEKRLPVLRLAEGQSTVGLDIDIDSRGDQNALRGARGEVHLDPPRFALSFVNTVVVWTLGTLLVLIGAIQWGRQVAAVQVGTMHPTENDQRQRIWCMLCHLSALLGYLVPFAHVLVPLIIWVSRRNAIPGVDDAGRESLNFQLTVSLFGLIGVMLSAVFVGLVMLFVLVVFHVSMTLFATLQAQRGKQVRYPVCLRIISPGK